MSIVGYFIVEDTEAIETNNKIKTLHILEL